MSENDDNFLVTSPLQIRALLRSILEQGALMRMFTKGRSLTLVTVLLEIDEETQTIVVGDSVDDDFNRRLIAIDTVSFETTLNKISVAFTSAQTDYCMHDGKPALRLLFPQSIRRMQRREFYRVNVPMGQPALCTLTSPTEITVAIKDISAGGISIIDDKHTLHKIPGTVYPKCQLVLPDTGTLETDLLVRRSHDETLPNGKIICIIGCQFINLPNRMHILVQNYIGRLERKLSARLRGFD